MAVLKHFGETVLGLTWQFLSAITWHKTGVLSQIAWSKEKPTPSLGSNFIVLREKSGWGTTPRLGEAKHGSMSRTARPGTDHETRETARGGGLIEKGSTWVNVLKGPMAQGPPMSLFLLDNPPSKTVENHRVVHEKRPSYTSMFVEELKPPTSRNKI